VEILTHVILTAIANSTGEFCHAKNETQWLEVCASTTIALLETLVHDWFVPALSHFAGGERNDSQSLERFQSQIQIGRATAAKPVMRGRSFRPLVEGGKGGIASCD